VQLFQFLFFVPGNPKMQLRKNSHQEKLLSGLKEKKTHHVGARRQK